MSASDQPLPFHVVIPARLGSTRLPCKVLRELAGKPMLQWTWEAAQTAGADSVIVATDDTRVLDVCRSFGADARMTSLAHQSGTDRVNEIAQAAGWTDETLVVNLQGDEPLMPPAMIRETVRLLVEDERADIATLCHPLHTREDWLNPNVVKVAMADNGHALYFSRAPIPWKREGASTAAAMPEGLAYRHIGLYAYRVGTLRRFSALPPASLESCEALEQLRALANGLRIKVGVTQASPPRGVDTEDDLLAVSALLAMRRS